MQVWVEHNYGTCMLANNLSFSILRGLAKRGILYFIRQGVVSKSLNNFGNLRNELK